MRRTIGGILAGVLLGMTLGLVLAVLAAPSALVGLVTLAGFGLGYWLVKRGDDNDYLKDLYRKG